MGILRKFFKPDIEKMERKGDVEGLIKALKHEDSDVRREAEEALGRIGGPIAVEPLFDMFKDKEETDGVRRGALRSLKKMGSSEVVELFISVLKDKSQDVDVRVGVTEALGELGGPRATEALIGVFKDKNEDVSVRYQTGCSFKIERIASPRAAVNPKVVESLVEVLTDKDENITLRAGSIEVLESMSRSPGSVGLISRSARALIKVADDKDEDQRVREQAEWALGKIRGWLEKHRQEDLGLKPLFEPEDSPEARERWGKVEELLAEIRDFFGKRYPIAVGVSFKRPKKCPKCGGEKFTFSIDHKCFRCEQCGMLIESEYTYI